VARPREEFSDIELKRSRNPQHYITMNHVSDGTIARAHKLSIPAQSGRHQGNTAALTGTSGSLGSKGFNMWQRQFRTIVELWLLKAPLFSFAILRRMGYQ
jgi:hypothetical protein